MKNSMLIWFIIALVVVAGGIVYMNKPSQVSDYNNQNNQGNTINDGTAQKITLGIKNGNYYPNTITVKSGSPVELTLDSSIGGCFRSFTIRDLGVSKYSKNPSDTITFTPTQKGTYRFACSMGMGTGTIIVE